MISNKSKPSGFILHPYQQSAIDELFAKMQAARPSSRLLYQLPTGAGKTVIFSEIASRFILRYNTKVMVLTHRVELCKQTSATMKKVGIKNKVIDREFKSQKKNDRYSCFVAMVETLKNRIRSGEIRTDDIGLLIIDEAHHNSFHKLLKRFKNARVIGVTATPLSSDINLPMNKSYDELVLGESIASLVSQGFLARPKTLCYDVELNTLKTGLQGDFTQGSSDELYTSPPMLELLLNTYEAHSRGKKTLIFNNGIFASRAVCKYFEDAGYTIKHLDNHTSPSDRADILHWFKKTRGAILTSVSLLTTGFDEPAVQTVILNRATTSLTLYHQMIGRASRKLPHKKTFNIIDLGNNVERFGAWEAEIDWKLVFERPEAYYQAMHSRSEYEAHHIPLHLKELFPNSRQVSFDVQQAYYKALDMQKKPKTVVQASIRQHALMVLENSQSVAEAHALIEKLDKEILWRVKQYGKCLGRVTKNYLNWLEEDYKSKLRFLIEKLFVRKNLRDPALVTALSA